MKNLFCTKILIAVTLSVAAFVPVASQAQEQPIPPPAADGALPDGIVPGSPLAEVIKMVQAGVDAGTVQNYIVNSTSAFNLDADKIIYLKDVGVPNDLVNAMLNRDKILYAATMNPPVAPTTTVTTYDTAPPPTEVTVNYFYGALAPYGSWVEVDGYGRCWRPTVVVYNSSWRPYCERGHWYDTDYGWYWDSDYSWGMTFHYGRWFRHPRFGWCWYPDTVWAPSWVTWRSGGDYCGWAPLPPFAIFTPGAGFFFRGARVGVDFDFGLGPDAFMFVSAEHFCDRHPNSYVVSSSHVTQIFRQTTVINNFTVNNHTFVNHGIPVEHISSATHHAIEPVHVSSLPNAAKQGWRGEGFQHAVQHSSTGNNAGENLSGGSQLRHGPELHQDVNNTTTASHNQTSGQTSVGAKSTGNAFESSHSISQQNQNGKSQGNNNETVYPLQHHNPAPVTGNTYVQPSPAPSSKVTEPRQTQNNLQSGGGQSQIISHEQEAAQSRQIRSYGTSSGQQQHGASQLEQRQYVAPIQPHIEVHQNNAEPAHTPPPQPPPAPATSGSHSSNNGSNNGSDKSKDNH